MIEGLPWQAWISVAGTGWTVVALLLINFANGRWFVSRREADTYLDRARHAEGLNDDMTKALAGFTAVGQLQKALVEARERATDSGDS